MSAHGALPDFDLYGALGVEPDADRATIERAWRSAVRAAHPDRADAHGERVATGQTARLNIARDWLVDPVLRRRYDSLRRGAASVPLPDIDPTGPWPDRPQSGSVRLWSMVNLAPVAVAVIAMALALLVGVGSNVVTIVVFDLGAVTVAYYGLFALIGAMHRRWRD